MAWRRKLRKKTKTPCAEVVSVTLSSDVQFCGVTVFTATDKLSEMSDQGGYRAVCPDQEPNCFSTVRYQRVLLLKNGAPTPALRGFLCSSRASSFDESSKLHLEMVILSFQAQPCVSLPDNSSLFRYGQPSSCVPLSAAF